MSNQNDHHPLFAVVNAKLAEIVAASLVRPPWFSGWMQLGPQSSLEERLAVYREVRAANSLPAEAGFFLVALVFDQLTDERAVEGLREVEDQLEAVQRKYGLDEDTPAAGDDVPTEYKEVMQQCHDAWDNLYTATIEEYGEDDMARLFREHPDEFELRYEAGRQFFHGPSDDETEDDDWLDLLLDSVAGCIEADSPMGPLGLRYWQEEDFWEVSVYPTPVELVGGAHDGEVVVPGFRLDLDQFRQEFDSVVATGWNALGLNRPEGPHVYVEGVFQGREIYLQVLAYAPQDEEPGLKLNAMPRRRRRSE